MSNSLYNKTKLSVKAPAKTRWRKDKIRLLQGQTTRTRQRVVMQRSILMPRDRADALAVALAAQPGVLAAEAVRDHHLIGDVPRWYVRYRRVAEQLLAAPAQSQADIRAERGVLQLPEMEFFAHLDVPEHFWCVHTYPDVVGDCGVYVVHPYDHCTCPDYHFTCQSAGIACKHQNALRVHQGLPDVRPNPRPKETVQERRERLRREAAYDY